MKEYIFSLPIPIVALILLVFVIAIVIIAIRGHLAFKFGDKVINIGGGGNEDTSPTPPPTVVISERKRTCGDCILVLMGEREKLEFKVRQKTNKIMKTQMTFVEQKLIEIQTSILDAVSKKFNKDSSIDESIQYKLVYGLLKDALHKIKDEVRRSFKDNGFCDMNINEFSAYIKDRKQVLYSMLTYYIRNMYPDRGGVLNVDTILRAIESKSPFLTELIHDMYMFSRDVKKETDKEVKKALQDFSEWVDKFIK